MNWRNAIAIWKQKEKCEKPCAYKEAQKAEKPRTCEKKKGGTQETKPSVSPE
jgi:hypothetical protein